jgi:hypothetical protein
MVSCDDGTAFDRDACGCDLPAEFAGQLGKARGYPALVPG